MTEIDYLKRMNRLLWEYYLGAESKNMGRWKMARKSIQAQLPKGFEASDGIIGWIPPYIEPEKETL